MQPESLLAGRPCDLFTAIPDRLKHVRSVAAPGLVLAALCLFTARGETAPGFLWARSGGGASNEVARAVAVDLSGNILVTGFFDGTMSLGGSNLVSSGLEDIFLAKYDPAGNCLWVRQAGGTGYDEGWGVATDTAGNVYLIGLYQNTAAFGTASVTSAGLSDIYIAKYDPNGALLWVSSAGGRDYDEAHAVAVDAAGNAYITGFFDANATFGAYSLLNHSGSDDIFVAKCSSSGAFLWAVQAGGALDDQGNSISLDAGTTACRMSFSPDTIPPATCSGSARPAVEGMTRATALRSTPKEISHSSASSLPRRLSALQTSAATALMLSWRATTAQATAFGSAIAAVTTLSMVIPAWGWRSTISATAS